MLFIKYALGILLALRVLGSALPFDGLPHTNQPSAAALADTADPLGIGGGDHVGG